MKIDNKAMARRIVSTLSTAQYLGAAPELTVRLLAKMKDANASVDDIAELMRVSPTISASLLKLCNSAYYYRGNAIDSVPRAVVHLGLAAVARFVYAMDMMGVFTGPAAAPGFDEAAFWKSSLAGAFLAGEIAETMRSDCGESAFLGGLLRDIGVCVIRQYFPDLFEETWAVAGSGKCSFDDACRGVCGIDHRSIAFLLAMRWKLPDAVTAVFQAPSPGHGDFRRLTDIRNLVLYSDHALRTRKTFAWDPCAQGGGLSAVSVFVAAEALDGMVCRIASDVNQLHEALR